MPRGCSLTDIEKGQILAYKDENLSLRKISKRLGRSLCVVPNFLNDQDNCGKTKRSGRKKKLSERDITHITRLASQPKVYTAKKWSKCFKIHYTSSYFQ